MLNPHNQPLTCVRKPVSSHLLISSLLQALPSFEMLCYGKKTWPWFMLTWLMLLGKVIQTIYTTTTETVTTTTTTIQTIPSHLCLILFLVPFATPSMPWSKSSMKAFAAEAPISMEPCPWLGGCGKMVLVESTWPRSNGSVLMEKKHPWWVG